MSAKKSVVIKSKRIGASAGKRFTGVYRAKVGRVPIITESRFGQAGITDATAMAVKKIPGFKQDGYLLVPDSLAKPVAPDKISKGLKKVKSKIVDMLDEFGDILTTKYAISEIELSASFDADGKFLGFGIGGAASIKVKIKPI